MTAQPYNPLNTARDLKAAGADEVLAETIAGAIGAVTEGLDEKFSTKADLKEEIGNLKADLREEVGNLKADLREEVGNLKADLIKWIVGVQLGSLVALAAVVSAVVAVIKLLE